jgi:predicted dehydrogenase
MKVAICGLGDMGMVHFETLAALEDTVVVAAADPDPDKAARARNRGIRVYPAAEEMIGEIKADCVSIATPTSSHARLAIRALERGMDVFCEKPLARTFEEGVAMVRAAQKARKLLGAGYVLRFHDAYRLAREMARGGRLGQIGTVRTSRCAHLSAPWHRDVEANGGATFELLTHDLDWLSWTLGPVRRVFARGLARGKKTVERDYTLAVLRFADGTIGHLEGSLAEAGEFYAAYEIAGDAGLLAYDTRRAATLEARLMTAEGVETLSEAPQAVRPFVRQMRSFAQALAGGAPYEVSGEAALPALRLAEAVYESVQTGSRVEV